MAKNNHPSKKSEKVQLAKIGAMQAIIVALIGVATGAVPAYFAGKQQGERISVVEPTPTPSQEPTPEITTYNDARLEEKIKGAEKRVWAIGTKLTPFEPPLVLHLIDKINTHPPFEVQLVLSNPDSDSLRQRIEDEQSRDWPEEERKAKAQKEISEVQRDIRRKFSWLGDLYTKVHDDYKKNMIVKCSELYPSIAVIIIDNDLYTYSYPHGETAAKSVVIVFRNYERNSKIQHLAEFFQRHLKTVVKDASKIDSGKCK
jgi:hypothetical protein